MANLLQTIKYIRTLNSGSFHTSLINNNKAMKKIISGGTKKKHRFMEATPILLNPKTFVKGSAEGKKSGNYKRVTVLNKLFMRHITDLMATRTDLVGQRIEINKVQVTPDFQCVKVFWLAKGTESDEFIEDTLQSEAVGLRHDLSQLRVMGVVPKIRFVKDKQFSQIMEVDLRLAKADFGDDHCPIESTSRLKSELHLNTKLDSKLMHEIEKLDKVEDLKIDDIYVPAMPQNVLGLNHADILERCKKLLNKSQALHRVEDSSLITKQMPQSINEDPLKYNSMKSQRQAFRDFLTKRQLVKSKANKENKYNRPELDYLEDVEFMRKQQQEFPNFEQFLDDKDYVDDFNNELNK